MRVAWLVLLVGCAAPAPRAALQPRATVHTVPAPTRADCPPPRDPPPALGGLYLRCADRGCREGIGMIVGPPEVLGADGQPNRCTGALVANDRVLTAAHCLPPASRGAGRACDGVWVAFPAAGDREMEWAACSRVLDAPAVRDDDVLRPDWALLSLHRPVARAVLPIEASDPPPQAIVEVVAVDPHPIYPTQHAIGTRLCRVRTTDEAQAIFGPDATRVGWLSDCPTVNGNSGAPVLDHLGRVRGILHGGSNPRQAIGVTTRIPSGVVGM